MRPDSDDGIRQVDDIEFKISRLDLRPGDILVVRCPFLITAATAARLAAAVKEATGGHRALILDGGMDLAILTAAEIEARSTAPTSDEAAAQLHCEFCRGKGGFRCLTESAARVCPDAPKRVRPTAVEDVA